MLHRDKANKFNHWKFFKKGYFHLSSKFSKVSLIKNEVVDRPGKLQCLIWKLFLQNLGLLKNTIVIGSSRKCKNWSFISFAFKKWIRAFKRNMSSFQLRTYFVCIMLLISFCLNNITVLLNRLLFIDRFLNDVLKLMDCLCSFI